ncbi:MAG: hypothetical protein C4586_00010 [Anaerolineaceae bacterium]|nr:MAG: hypothetical protein C4586_00010 [Anaerolineaceae bacterium]
MYKLIGNEQTCKLTASSNPDMGDEGVRRIQPCFNRIVLLQNILSIIGWCLLAWVTARHINSIPYKIVVTLLILTFGFTPQIAEWDSILSSESLSLSLFPIGFAILQEIVFWMAEKRENSPNLKVNILLVLWLCVFSLWLFVRDVHIYALISTLVLTVPFLLLRKFRQIKVLTVVIVILAGLFIIQNHASKLSPRWQPSLSHVLEYYIFPYPARVDFFFEHGMPKNMESEEYHVWFGEEGVKTYALFLISHPGFILSNTLELSSYLKSDFIQPHFKSPENPYRNVLMIFGEIVHPESNAVYFIDLMVFSSLCATALKYRDKNTIAWTWLALWVLTYSAISLFVTLFGDIDGTRRHIFPSVELFRLFLWIFLTAQIDQTLNNKHMEVLSS